MEFEAFPKIPRLKRGCLITEKIDGTNAQIGITPDGRVFAGSRSRWLQPGKSTDNYGFAAWVEDNKEELLKLGHGRHFGEWWGKGIQRGYGLDHKRFSLFRARPIEFLPSCVGVVPVLYAGDFSSTVVDEMVSMLAAEGSVAAPDFVDPEGVVVFLPAASHLYKVLCKGDSLPKTATNPQEPS